MPKNEPDASDPMELVAVGPGGPGAGNTALLVESLTREFLSMGHTRVEVMSIFRSPAYPLAYGAWLELGEVRTFSLVSECAAARRLRNA